MIDHAIWHNMFAMPLSFAEKVLRPVVVYIVLVIFLRLFGKRELAQLNPFDLVVLLSLSNTVQNAMIGDDNSVSGGIIGAFSLLAINWILSKTTYRLPFLNRTLQGGQAVLIRDGKVDEQALDQETITHDELISILNRNGFDDPAQVRICVLEPNGTFFVQGIKPDAETTHSTAVLAALDKLQREMATLRAELAAQKKAA